jgi:hypothetical protein
VTSSASLSCATATSSSEIKLPLYLQVNWAPPSRLSLKLIKPPHFLPTGIACQCLTARKCGCRCSLLFCFPLKFCASLSCLLFAGAHCGRAAAARCEYGSHRSAVTALACKSSSTHIHMHIHTCIYTYHHLPRSGATLMGPWSCLQVLHSSVFVFLVFSSSSFAANPRNCIFKYTSLQSHDYMCVCVCIYIYIYNVHA